MIGELLDGTYRIESLIGRGGMGAVYKAQHERLRGHFAVKVLDVPDEEHRPQRVARFRREARVTSALAHPHIVAVTDYNVTSEGSPYIVMELLEGEDLASHLRRKHRLRLDQAAVILQQLASALQSAHDAGVVHRDLKPSNVFLCRRTDEEVQVKVLDFGISKVVGAWTAMTLTQQMIGTPAFMAPEQAQGEASAVDQRADIFAVGGMLYQMLAGKKPFEAESVPKLLFKVVYEQAPPLTELRPDLPLAVIEVVERALSKKPEERQASMAQLWREFRAASDLGDAVVTLSASRWRLTQRVNLDALASQSDVSATEETAGALPSLFGAETAASLVDESATIESQDTPAQRGSLGWRFWAGAASVIVLVAVGSLVLGLSLAQRDGVSAMAGDGPSASSEATSLSGRDGAPEIGRRGRRDAGMPNKRRENVARRARAKTTRRGAAATSSLRVSAVSAGRPIPATITLDGRPVGQAPLLLKGLKAGRHRLEARQAGMRPGRRTVRLRRGKQGRVVFELRPR